MLIFVVCRLRYLHTMVDDNRTEFSVGRDAPTLQMTRVLNAPRSLVFRALTEPGLVSQWWGSFVEEPLETCEVDLRQGVRWRFVERMTDGKHLASSGTYEEIDPPSRLVQTLKFDADPWKGRTARLTFVLDDLGDKTRLTITTRFASFADRDGMDIEGARRAGEVPFERLGRLLNQLQAS